MNNQYSSHWILSRFYQRVWIHQMEQKLLPKFRPAGHPTQPQSRVNTAFQMRLLKTFSCMAGKAERCIYSDGCAYLRSSQAFLCQIQSPNPGQQLKTGQNFVKCAYLTDTPHACFYIQEEQEPFPRNKAEKCKLGKKKSPSSPFQQLGRERTLWSHQKSWYSSYQKGKSGGKTKWWIKKNSLFISSSD